MVRMNPRADARLAINELLAQHGHLVDEGALDRRGELFTDPFADGLQVRRHHVSGALRPLERRGLTCGLNPRAPRAAWAAERLSALGSSGVEYPKAVQRDYDRQGSPHPRGEWRCPSRLGPFEGPRSMVAPHAGEGGALVLEPCSGAEGVGDRYAARSRGARTLSDPPRLTVRSGSLCDASGNIGIAVGGRPRRVGVLPGVSEGRAGCSSGGSPIRVGVPPPKV